MIAAIHAEWGKLWSLRSPWICLLAAALLVPGTAFTLANDSMLDVREGRLPSNATVSPLDILGSAMQFGLAMFIAFAMLTITSEYVTGSIRSTLLAEPRRWRVLASKTVVVTVAASLTGGAVGAAAYEITCRVLANHAGSGTSLVSVFIRSGALAALATILVCGLAMLVRSSVGTLAAAFGLLVGTLAFPDPLGSWLPAHAGSDLLSLHGSTGAAASVLVAWAAAAWLAGWWALDGRDA